MKKKFFKNLFEKENNLQMYSINEFNVFRDIISFSKMEVYKEMKSILGEINKNIDRQMAESVEKYHIVMGLKSQTEEISSHLTGEEEEIDVVISDAKEANIIARYSEKMLHKLLEVGFASSDRELEKKAMTVTYSKRIMMKLDNLAKKDPAFVEAHCSADIEESRENAEFIDIEEANENKFERFNEDKFENYNEDELKKSNNIEELGEKDDSYVEIMENFDDEDFHVEITNLEEKNMEEIQEDLEEIIDGIECNSSTENDITESNNVANVNNCVADKAEDSDEVEFKGELKINIYGEDDSVSDKNNTSGVDEGGIDMIDEKYSKEAYDLFVKGDDEEVSEDIKKLGEEEYDVIIRETEDTVLRDNEDKIKVGEEAYEELIKGRKIKEVEEDEY